MQLPELLLQKSQWLRNQLFPPACLFCLQPLRLNGCCESCLKQIYPFPSSTCDGCGAVLPQALAPGPCGQCLKVPAVQKKTVSLYLYQDVVRDAVLAWKLRGQESGVRWLLQAAQTRMKQIVSSKDLVLPVPMPLSRMRLRGRHHGADLARMMAESVGCAWDWRLLRRIGEQARQSNLTGADRRKNLRKAFMVDMACWQACEPVQGRLWLVDDVITTGSTVHFAAKALRATGMDVHVLSLTRTVKGV